MFFHSYRIKIIRFLTLISMIFFIKRLVNGFDSYFSPIKEKNFSIFLHLFKFRILDKNNTKRNFYKKTASFKNFSDISSKYTLKALVVDLKKRIKFLAL